VKAGDLIRDPLYGPGMIIGVEKYGIEKLYSIYFYERNEKLFLRSEMIQAYAELISESR